MAEALTGFALVCLETVGQLLYLLLQTGLIVSDKFNQIDPLNTSLGGLVEIAANAIPNNVRHRQIEYLGV